MKMHKMKRLTKVLLSCLLVLAISFMPFTEVEAKTTVTEKKIENYYDLVAGFKDDGIIEVRNGNYGLINTKGKEITKCKYDEVFDFYEGMARVKRYERYGFVNSKGKEVVECIYSYASDFSNGLAKVQIDGEDSVQKQENSF